jgi:8-oxo-dGTP pyrophosphatase MutT (NUDIX family)
MIRPNVEALSLVTGFVPAPEDEKSRELILALLEHTPTPFSRHQYHAGHITCSALVLSPDSRRVLLMFHNRHQRWLLPGGHVEESDATLEETARRETLEETAVPTLSDGGMRLLGLDVHGIPARPRKGEPFHLHHDLIFGLRAGSDEFLVTEEAPRVAWCGIDELARYDVPANILRAAGRGAVR